MTSKEESSENATQLIRPTDSLPRRRLNYKAVIRLALTQVIVLSLAWPGYEMIG